MWLSKQPPHDTAIVIDRLHNYFEPLQQHLKTNIEVLVLEQILFTLTFAGFCGWTIHWMLYGDNFKIPLVFVFFQILKLLSDTSLFIEAPLKLLWVDFDFLGYPIRYQSWFLSNVDPYVGMMLVGFYTFWSTKSWNKWVNRLMMSFYILSLITIVLIEFTLQLMNFYAVYSGFVCFFGAIWLSKWMLNWEIKIDVIF